MPNQFQKIADPGVWIVLILIILLIGFGFYGYYKQGGGNEQLDKLINEISDSFESGVVVDTTNHNYNANTNLNRNTYSNNSNLNSTSSVNTTAKAIEVGDFKWYELQPISDLIIPDFNIGISINHVDSGFERISLDIYYMNRDTYNGKETNPGNTGWVPNSAIYGNDYSSNTLLEYAKTLYRTHYNCNGTIDDSLYPLGRETIDLTTGYSNYLCRNRQYEQCELDGTYDRYYDEKCDFSNVYFYEGSIKCHDNYIIAVKNISGTKVDVGLVKIKDGMDCSILEIE